MRAGADTSEFRCVVFPQSTAEPTVAMRRTNNAPRSSSQRMTRYSAARNVSSSFAPFVFPILRALLVRLAETSGNILTFLTDYVVI